MTGLGPPEYRTLKRRAAASGMSLSEYVRRMLERQASRSMPEELYVRIGEAMFVALTETIDEPLVTMDRSLAAAARRPTSIEVLLLTTGTD